MIGVGWVGLVTAACFAELGHQVIARDILAEKVEALSRGEIDDPRARADRAAAAATPSGSPSPPTWSELLDGARLLFVCVDTPPTYSGDADLSRVRAVVDELPDGRRPRRW